MSQPASAPNLRAVAWTDGASRGNPGEAGAGILLELGNGRTEQHALYLGRATNNEAEYAALLAALGRLVELGVFEVEVRSDSQLLVRQIDGRYRVKAEHLRPLWVQAITLARRFRRFSIRHVPREANTSADDLANQAINNQRSTLPLPQGWPLAAPRGEPATPTFPSFSEDP